MDTAIASQLLKDWTPPDVLRRSRPREVSLTRAGVGVSIIAVLLVIGGILVTVLVGGQIARESANARLLQSQGVSTMGEVARLWITGGEDPSYRVAYRFHVDSRAVDGRQTIARAQWARLQEGEAVDLLYVPSRPSVSCLAGSIPKPKPAWVQFVVGIPLIVGGLLLPLQIRRQKRLLSEGKPAPAVITKNRRVYYQHGARQNITLYEFVLPDGSVRKGRGCASRQLGPSGAGICVLYDPDNPRRSAPYPMKLVKVADW